MICMNVDKQVHVKNNLNILLGMIKFIHEPKQFER